MAGKIIKVLDATVLSAFLFEIKSIDVLIRCVGIYNLVTSQEVFVEISRSRRVSNMESIQNFVQAEPLSQNETLLMNYLEVRYPALHRGELSSFISALRYSRSGSQCYFVTDDKAMRTSIDKILEDMEFIRMVGVESKVNLTGTIGLIMHLCEKGHLQKAECMEIGNDLASSTFRFSPQLLARFKS